MAELHPKIKLPPIKKPVKIPSKEKTVDALDNALNPIYTFDFESDDNYSEISDPFEDLHKESFLNKKTQNNKYVKKPEADVLTMNQFTELNKKIKREIRDELKVFRV